MLKRKDDLGRKEAPCLLRDPVGTVQGTRVLHRCVRMCVCVCVCVCTCACDSVLMCVPAVLCVLCVVCVVFVVVNN